MPTDEQIEKAARALGKYACQCFGPGTLANMARDALSAAEGVKPRVKPLEWAKHPHGKLWRAQTIIGIYQVYAVRLPAKWHFDSFDGLTSVTVGSEDEPTAFAAAQADYEARIRSALEGA